MKKTVALFIILMMVFSAIPVFGAENAGLPKSFSLKVTASEGVELVHPQEIRGENWLFIPSSCNIQKLKFSGLQNIRLSNGGSTEYMSSGAINLTKLFPNTPGDGVYRVKVYWDNGSANLNIMKSANISALFLKSADPAKGREWVESSVDKTNKAKGDMTMLNPDGSVTYAGGLKQIKGRGNSTWREAKKPYQIKLTEKVDLMETGEESEANDTWVLLTNYADSTLISNKAMLDLCSDLGLSYTPNCKSVDLYYDGEYRGNYLLCEKTEVGKGRVNIKNLEKSIKEVNPSVEDMDSLPTVKSKTSLGTACQYVKGLELPEDYSGGYLLELDYSSRAMEEKTWFQTKNDRYYTVKSPEYLPKAGVEYISTKFQELENAIGNKGIDPVSGKTLSEIADLESMAKFFLVEEISYDFDAYVSSSYLYKDAGDELFYSGPGWDFDSVVGIRIVDEVINTNRFHAGNTSIGKQLLQCEEFKNETKKVYVEEFLPLMDVLFDGKTSFNQDRLKSINAYRDELKKSEAMNRVIWPEKAYHGGYNAIVNNWKTQLKNHNSWLKNQIANWKWDGFYFLDVGANDWFYDDVKYTYENGIMKGVSNALFQPNGDVNRAMVVTILHRIAGEPSSADGTNFTDVSEGEWYSEAVKWASSTGVVEGYPDGTFGPEKSITREEFATLLYRYVELTEGVPETTDEETLSKFSDGDLVSDWALLGTTWAVETGLINGTDEGKLDPQGHTKRCQAAAIIHRFLV